jgi:hypothetical protein
VTLANKDVQKALNERFLCSWLDTQGDPDSGGSFAHGPKEPAPDVLRGNGDHNVQILFLTPQGEIFHAVAGYAEPKDLLDEIALAQRIYAGIRMPGVDRAALVSVMENAAAAEARSTLDTSPVPGRGALALGASGLGASGLSVVRAREFVRDHPLMAAARFHPSLMFGFGGSFFGSRSGSTSGKGLIGHPPDPGAPFDKKAFEEAIRKALEEQGLKTGSDGTADFGSAGVKAFREAVRKALEKLGLRGDVLVE